MDQFLEKPLRSFLKIFLNPIENQRIIHLSSNYASLVQSDSEVTFLWKGKMQPFVHFSIVFWLQYGVG